jgi:phenylpropionate dioxygenase-like ring-hydroxylating dioxygenase large terminal subunit
MRARLHEGSELRIQLEETATGFNLRSELDGAGGLAQLEWRRPNGMVLRILPGAPPERGFRQHVFCIPIDAATTRLMVISTRTFLRYSPLGWLSDQFNRLIVSEDRAIVESSQPVIVPPPAEETSVATDAPTLYFRRWYHRTLAPGGAQLVPAARLQRRRGAAPVEGTEASRVAG